MKRALLLGLLTLILPLGAWAAASEDCYATARVPLEKQAYTTSNVILLDETTVFDQAQKEHILQQVGAVVQHGSEVRILSFSAYIDGRYTRPWLDVRMAAPLDDATRYNMRRDGLRNFDTCLEVSLLRARTAVRKVLVDYFARSSDKISRSDILSTLNSVGTQVFPAISMRKKRLIVVSDMLENSDLANFYASGGLRQIDAAQEIARAEKKSLMTDFRGAEVYIIGAGVTPATKPGSYVAAGIIGPLKSFWSTYFTKSNSQVIEFGQPLLLNGIGGR